MSEGTTSDDAPRVDGAPDDAMLAAEHANAQYEHRRAKLDRMRQEGTNPYPFRFTPDNAIGDLAQRYGSLQPNQTTSDRVTVAGRITLIRRQGGLTFADLQDRTGSIQLFVDTHDVGEQAHAGFDDLDRGDWVGVTGTVMTTRRGELSVGLESYELLGKALIPPPDQHRGLTDVETRYRQRYVDLVANENTRRIFAIRHRAIRAIRDYLHGLGFIEVEGPVLQTIQGGASARPFITHHNALNLDMYLRIALELHLKRLIVGGMERVFEISRTFRNEGIDTRHNPEFTMLEAYQAYSDYHGMMDLAEGIIVTAARAALGDNLTVSFAGQQLDLTPPWPRTSMSALIQEHTGAVMDPGMPIAEARAILAQHSVPYEQDWGAGKCMNALYDEKVQHSVVGPVFCMDYPEEVSPLARAHRDKPGYVERFELIVAGFELCNAYSEQNDPAKQLEAFEAEARAKAGGDPEAGDIDYDYIRALEHGMPCTGGLGIGIDRMMMLLASVDSIREVILFPTLRPEFAPPPGQGPSGAPRVLAPPTGTVDGATTLLPAGPTPVTAAGGATVRMSKQDRRVPRTLAWLTGLGGVLALLTLLPFVHSRLGVNQDLLTGGFRVTSHVLTALAGLGLLVLAGQLAKQKQTAWRLTTGLFTAVGVLSVLKGPHPVAALYCAGMVTALVLARRRFRAAADPPSLFRLLRLAPLYAAAVLLFGFGALLVERNRIDPGLSFWGGFRTIVAGLVGAGGAYDYRSRFFGDFFPAALLVLGIAGLAGLAYLVFQPLRARSPHTGDDWSHAQRLVHTYGWDTLAYFALRDDKSFLFASDGEAMIAYTFVGGHALVSGDPIGRAESLPLVVDEFLAMCEERAWTPAFLAVREADLPVYEARGLHGFYLGDEAIVRCDTFSLQGAEMKGVRSAVRKVGRNYRFQLVKESTASARLVEQLNAISEKWRGKAPERGFTMSLSQDVQGAGANPEFLLCVAVDENGVPGGFLRLVPAYGASFGYTLDLMRHDPGAPNGMTEFLIASTAQALGERGVVRLSMNFAVSGRLFEPDIELSAAQRLQKKVVTVLNPYFQIKSLHDFNAKFSPEWLSRSLVYRDRADLPRVGLLYAGAEGFLAVPGLGPLFIPKTVGGVPSPSTATPVRATDPPRAA